MVFHSETVVPADDPWKGVLEDECEDIISLSVGVGRVPYGEPEPSSGSFPCMRVLRSVMRLYS
jgi:hypothetical protein